MLIKSLPSDVEDYILKYLIMPLDIETLNRVSKNVKKLVNNTKFVIEKNKITDKILMLIEDDFFFKYRTFYKIKDLFLKINDIFKKMTEFFLQILDFFQNCGPLFKNIRLF